MTTLVTLPSALGDTIRCLPAVDALAASGRRLLLLAEPRALPLLQLRSPVPALAPRLGEAAPTRAVIRSLGCDEAVLLSRRTGDAWLARTARVRRIWGYPWFPGGFLLLSRRARPAPRRTRAARPATEDARELLAAMGVPWGRCEPELFFGERPRAEARERLARAKIEPNGEPVLGIYAGTEGGGADRPWPRIRFEELLRQQRRRHPKTRFILLATTDDLWTAVRVHEETGKIHPVLGPDLGLDVLAAVLSELDAVVAVESAMLDLAAAAGTRTLGLYLRDPRRWAPPGARHQALRAARGSVRDIVLDDVLSVLESWSS